jgi:MoxR-like ATPase
MSTTGPLQGKKVTLTGAIPGMSRDEFKQKVLDAGGEYVLALDDGLDAMVLGDGAVPARVEKARALGARVEPWQAFLAALTQDAATDVPLATSADTIVGAALQLEEHSVRVLDVTLPRNPRPGPLAPSLASFAHYTLDAGTLSMLRFLSIAVTLRHPCLLEGETATSKTSAILFLAALTGQQVVRINLNGQTDTSELVGRYVPNEQSMSLPTEALRQHFDILESETRRILRQANEERRPLTDVEAQQVAANERMQPPSWRFEEGLIPKAMRHGWWVILDEMNLSEPQVLERLNSVLERDPGLVLTEGSGLRFGRGGDVEVHPEFRLFATMNPAEYQGRAVLSPAFKDRWTATWQAESPGELEYRQFLERVVFGAQPKVTLEGLTYASDERSESGDQQLADVPGMAAFLARVATLHAGMVEISLSKDGRAAALGSSRRERYVFSRRSLLAVLDTLRDLRLWDSAARREVGVREAPEWIAREAIERAYVSRVRGADDRARVVSLLRSLGLSRDNWLFRFDAAE